MATTELIALIDDRKNTRADVVDLYQTALMFSLDVDWPAVNAAIIERWSLAGLRHIKKLAWRDGPIEGLREPEPESREAGR